MKKFFKALLVGVGILSSFSAVAQTYRIFPTVAGENETLIPTTYQQWAGVVSNEVVTDETAPGGSYASFKNAADATYSHIAYDMAAGSFDFTPIAEGDYNLEFYIRTEMPGVVYLKFEDASAVKAIEKEIPTFEHNGEWQSITINLNEYCMEVLPYIEADHRVLPFSLVCKEFGGVSYSIDYADVKIVNAAADDKEAPTGLSVTPGEATPTGITLTATATDNSGYCIYEVYLDGAAEANISTKAKSGENATLAISGVAPGTEHSYEVKVKDIVGNYSAETYSNSFKTFTVETATFYGVGTAKQGDTEFSIPYSITYNADATLTVTADCGEFIPLLSNPTTFVCKVIIPRSWPADNNYLPLALVEGTEYSRITVGTYAPGETLNIQFWLEYGGGVNGDVKFTYEVGSASEPPVETPQPTVTADATNVTETSADIVYSVALPEELAGATVAVTINGEAVEYKAGEENTYSVTGLTANTSYDYVIVATATLDGTEYASKETKVSFKTLSDGSEVVYSGTLDCQLTSKNEGDVEYTIDYSVVYNPDKTLTVTSSWNFTVDNILGLSPTRFAYFNGAEMQMTQNENGSYGVTSSATFEENSEVRIGFKIMYAEGGDVEEFTYVVGSASEPVNPDVVSVAIANPKVDATNVSATVYFDVTVSESALGETVVIYKDGEEVYNFKAEETTTLVELSYTDLAPQSDFSYSYVAKVGDTESEPCVVTFSTLGSAPAEFTVSGYVTETVWAPTFTGNVSTGRNGNLLFEVTLPSLPTGFGGLQVFEVTETGNSLIATLSAAETAALADEYVFVGETEKEYANGDYVKFYFYVPYEAGQIAQTGNLGYTVGGNTVTGINGIEMEEGEAVYYNFQGVRVANPENGMYIRVQNGKATKVIVK